MVRGLCFDESWNDQSWSQILSRTVVLKLWLLEDVLESRETICQGQKYLLEQCLFLKLWLASDVLASHETIRHGKKISSRTAVLKLWLASNILGSRETIRHGHKYLLEQWFSNYRNALGSRENDQAALQKYMINFICCKNLMNAVLQIYRKTNGKKTYTNNFVEMQCFIKLKRVDI